MKRSLVGFGALVAAASLAVSGLTAPAAAAPVAETFFDGPPSSQVYIKDVAFGGTGCNRDNTTVSLSNDRKVMTMIHDEFEVKAGLVNNSNGTTVWENLVRKNCAVTLQLAFPRGWQFAVVTAIFSGYADLARKADGTQTTTYKWAGESKNSVGSTKLTGPYADMYAFTDKRPTLSYSECGATRALNYNAMVAVNSGRAPRDSSSLMTLDTQEVDVATEWSFQWRSC
ncbi:DUF4360 domain-containing protein [Pilimelia columellifera]|uniref:Secreted protein n=1 Tax=Pilimelia columellifera subsp. columellifera TaxID=706583 RepID=A0ABN3N774_9ACTN